LRLIQHKQTNNLNSRILIGRKTRSDTKDEYQIVVQNKFANSGSLSLKGGPSLKIKTLHIRLYFIATKYLWSNDLVEYIDKWTQSYRSI